MLIHKSDDAPTNSFKIHAERIVGEKVEFMSWCPTMDLLALCLITGEVQVYRLSWQRVWIIQPPRKPTQYPEHICWRPDGRVMALACADGSINLHNVHDGDLLHTVQRPSNAQITHINWVLESQDSSDHRRRTDLGGDPLSGLKSVTNTKSKRPRSGESWHNAQRSLKQADVLIFADTDGLLHFSLFGIFTFTVANLRKSFTDNLRILASCISANMTSVDLLVQLPSTDLPSMIPTVESTDGIITAILTISSDMLDPHRVEIRSITSRSSQVDMLIDYILDATSSIYSEWDGVKDVSTLYLTDLQKHLETSDTGTNPSLEYLHLLSFGIPSETLNDFLSNTFTERHLKRWMTTIDGAYSSIQETITDGLRPALEQLLTLLRELIGYCRLEEDEAMGLDERGIHSCMLLAASLLDQSYILENTIMHVMDSARNFGIWLHTVFDMISPVEEDEEEPTHQQIDGPGIVEFISQKDPLVKFFEPSGDEGIARFLPNVAFDTEEELEEPSTILERKVASPRGKMAPLTSSSVRVTTPFKASQTEKKTCAYPLPYVKQTMPNFNASDLSDQYDGPCIKSFVQVLEEKVRICFQGPAESLGVSYNIDRCIPITDGEVRKPCMRRMGDVTYIAFQRREAVHVLRSVDKGYEMATLSLGSNTGEQVELDFYDDQTIVICSSSLLIQYSIENLQFTAFTNDLTSTGIPITVERSRYFEETFKALQMSVNGRAGRNIAALLADDQQRIKIIDFAEDEEEDGDDETSHEMQE